MKNNKLTSSVILASLVLLLTVPLNTIAQEPTDSLIEKSFPGFVNLTFNQTGSVGSREVALGYGFNIKGKYSLDLSAGISSGFFIEKDKTSEHKKSLMSTLGLGHGTVLGFGKLIALNYFHDYGAPNESSIYHSISLKHKRFTGIRHPQDLMFDEYHLSVDEFKSKVNTLAIGLGYKYKFPECTIRFGIAWELQHTNYEAYGSQYAFQKSSIKVADNYIDYQNQFISNTLALKIALHM
ncbi:MAG: hypothetical protein ACJA0Q_000307 [Saprospiraceae bacterium]|jgi:hypothetical protein